jgi:hypothetical protein
MLTPVERLALWNLASGLRVERQVRRRLARAGYLDENGLTEKSHKALEAAAPYCKWEPPKQQGPALPQRPMPRSGLVAAFAAMSIAAAYPRAR